MAHQIGSSNPGISENSSETLQFWQTREYQEMSFMEKLKVGIETGLQDERIKVINNSNDDNATLSYHRSLRI